jgi:protoheme IX farnesyltransferase
LKQILWYTVTLCTVSLSLLAFGGGWLYLAVAVVLGYVFIKKAVALTRNHSDRLLRGLFGYSILYLFGLFTAMIIDGFVRWPIR